MTTKLKAAVTKHPIAATIPTELDIRHTLRLISVCVGERIEIGSSAEPPYRDLKLTYEIEMKENGICFQVEGEAEIEGVTFTPTGEPIERNEWAGVVNAALDNVLEEARSRMRELVTAGLKSEGREER